MAIVPFQPTVQRDIFICNIVGMLHIAGWKTSTNNCSVYLVGLAVVEGKEANLAMAAVCVQRVGTLSPVPGTALADDQFALKC